MAPRRTRALPRSVLVLFLLPCAAWGCGDSGPGPSDPPGDPVDPDPPAPLSLDCLGSSPACPEIVVQGDAPATLPGGEASPFRGFADPSVRRDPASGRLWMAYSWPHVSVPSPGVRVPGVDIHLAHSDDGGATWIFDGPLWASTRAADAADPSSKGYLDHEVATLARTADGSAWYGARLDYFVPDEGGLPARPPSSFHLRIARAATPPALADAPSSVLGSRLTHAGWRVDVDLSSLDAALARCHLWNEPALHVDGTTLYLLVRCLTFDLATNVPRVADSDQVVFSTVPAGEPTAWTWRYEGVLAGGAEAVALGGRGLTQGDLARGTDGKLLAVLTPDDWSASERDFVHFGCRVVEVASLRPPRLARNPDGSLAVRATVTASDQGPLGPGACGYDPGSATGVLLVRRVIGGGLVASIHRTGLRP